MGKDEGELELVAHGLGVATAGAELGGVSVYLAEIAKPGHRGFYVAWQSASQQVAVLFAALLGLQMLQANLSGINRIDPRARPPLLEGVANRRTACGGEPERASKARGRSRALASGSDRAE